LGVNFALAVILFTAHLALALRTSIKQRWWLLAKIGHSLAELQALCRRCLTGSATRSREFDEELQQRLSDIRATALHKTCVLLTMVTLGILVVIIQRSHSGADRVLSLGQDIICFVFSAILCVRQCWPGLVNPSTLNLWYSVFMGWLSLMVAPGLCTLEDLAAVEKWMVPLAGLVSVTHLDARWATAWQALFSTSMSSNYLLGDLDSRTKRNSVMFLMSVSGLIVMCTAWLEKSLELFIRKQTEVGVLEGKQSAGNALLRIFYEVVMELNADMEITSAGDLSGFLQAGHGQSFLGTRLTDLIPQQEDRERFVEHVSCLPHADEGMANVMHLAMCAGVGPCRDLEAFSFGFKGLAGRSRYLIGLREFSDDAVAVERASSSAQDAAEASPEPSPRGEAAMEPPGDVWFKVDLMAEGVPVTAFSPGFRSLMGSLGGSPTLSTLVDSAPRVIEWLQARGNLHLNGEQEDTGPAVGFALRLRPRTQTNVRILATCHGDFSSVQPFSSEDESESAVPVVLTLRNIRYVRVLRRRRADDCGASTGSSSGSDGRRQGTPMHADGRHVGKLPKVQSL